MIETRIVLACDQCRSTDDRTVTAWTVSDVAGLAVNRMHLHSKHPAALDAAERSWVVSHLTGIGHGAVVFGQVAYEHRSQAEAALRNLGALPVDWRLPANDARFRDPVLVAVMSDAVDRAKALDLNLDLPGAEP